MKNLLFNILIVLLTPIYLIIKFIKGIMEFITYLTKPIAEGIYILIENMTEFWKNVFKKKGKEEYK